MGDQVATHLVGESITAAGRCGHPLFLPMLPEVRLLFGCGATAVPVSVLRIRSVWGGVNQHREMGGPRAEFPRTVPQRSRTETGRPVSRRVVRKRAFLLVNWQTIGKNG